MIQIRKSQERGHFNFGWLNTYHTFSFGDYYDPAYKGYRDLRVINEDIVQPGQGFPTHAHRDMEIITYILSGALEHKDSMGNGSVIRPGDIQRMSAGTGVTHSEYNASKKDPVHLLQIWILPKGKGIQPGYEQKTIKGEDKKNKLCLIASSEGNGVGVKIHQSAKVFACELEKGGTLDYQLPENRFVWLQVAGGEMDLNGQKLKPGDGAAVEKETLELKALLKSEFLLFDLA